jgi:hypothetical protein
MSDTSQGPGWWSAADGKWYPPPPGFSEKMPTRPPTPPPDHPPYEPHPNLTMPPPVYARVPTPSRRGTFLAVAVVAIALVIVMIGLVVGLVSKHSSTTAASNSREYRLVVTDILGTETTNKVFLQTFWEGEQQFVNAWNNATPAERDQIAASWLADADSQISQFRIDLQDIDELLNSETFANGSIPDSVRDAAVAHYRTWQNWAAAAPTLAQRWTIDSSGSSTLDTYIDAQQPTLGSDINSTFAHLCATLSSTRPTDGSYDATITSICPN